MIITNDIIKEASFLPQSYIGNRVALDAANPSSNVGLSNFWYDLSGNYNKSTLNNVVSGSDFFRFTPAINPTTLMASTFSYGTIVDSSSIDIAGWEITTEVWVKFTSLYGYNQNTGNPATWPLGINMNTQGIFGRWGTGGDRNRGQNYSLQVLDSGIYFNHYSGDHIYHSANYNTIGNFPGNWVQLVYKQDAKSWSIILNGDNLLASGTDVSILVPDNNPLYVGTRADYDVYERTTYSFYGDMSVLNIWDRALTDAEIKSNYNFYRQRYI